MIYKMTIKSNPKLLLLWLSIIAAPVIGIVILLKMGTTVGIIALLGAGFFAYHAFQFSTARMKQTVETSEEGIACQVSKSEHIQLPWDRISHAGLCRQKRGNPCIFLYSEQDDQFLTISNEFSDFENLKEEIRTRTDFQEIQLAKNETIKGWIKEQLL